MKKIARAHTNIALIKYWGKQNAALRLPLMSSLSMTLDAFYTDTYLEPSQQEQFYLNGQLIEGPEAQRVFNYLHLLQRRYGKSGNLSVHSQNHVPTAAGLASSSSAFAALAAAFAEYYQLPVNETELSRMARLGSGSASRSVFGGFAVWQKGTDDQSSFAYSLDSNPDLDLQLLAVEINTGAKKRSSTKGMQAAQTSPFFAPWIKRNSLELSQMINAIKNHDFTRIGQLAELNASEMHAVNLTAQPGFTYFEPTTIGVIQLVHEMRQNGIEVYYTIDAGPNVKLLCQLKNVKIVKEKLVSAFDHVKIINASFGPGIQYLDNYELD